MSGSGSLSKRGIVGLATGVPVLEKAPDFIRNSESAAMPSLVPSKDARERPLEALAKSFRCRWYLGQSLRMWFLVSRMSPSQGQVVGSADRRMNDWRNSSV